MNCMKKNNRISAIDLFCGAGGLTHGLIQSGINVAAGFDIQSSCRYPYEKNNSGAKFFNQDIKNIQAKDLLHLYPGNDIKLLAGCAPCQPFSKYSQGRDAKSDARWPLLYEFSRLIDGVMPELVTMENVPDVAKHKVYQDFVLHLKSAGFEVWAGKVYCPDYGMPQRRTRHVLMASRIGHVELVAPRTKTLVYKTVRKTIGKMPPLKAGEKDISDPLHAAAGLSDINITRIKKSKPGGSWLDWPPELRAACHRKESGKTYLGVYARMEWDEPSPTITTQCYGFGNGRFGHPEQNRAISLREAALLQTFPKGYKFLRPGEDVNFTKLGTMIGNAVPVTLGKIIGKSFLKNLY